MVLAVVAFVSEASRVCGEAAPSLPSRASEAARTLASGSEAAERDAAAKARSAAAAAAEAAEEEEGEPPLETRRRRAPASRHAACSSLSDWSLTEASRSEARAPRATAEAASGVRRPRARRGGGEGRQALP